MGNYWLNKSEGENWVFRIGESEPLKVRLPKRPHMTHDENQGFFGGEPITLPGRKDFAPIWIYADFALGVIDHNIMEFVNKTWDCSTMSCMFTGILERLEKSKVVETWVMEGAFFQAINFNELSVDSSDMTLEMNVRYNGLRNKTAGQKAVRFTR